MVEVPVLTRPHLVLTDARAHDRVVGRIVSQGLEHELRLERRTGLGRVVVERVLLLPTAERRLPLRRVGHRPSAVEHPADRRHQLLDDEAAVADDRHVGLAVLAELGGVDVDVDHLGVRRELVELAGDPVVEPGAEGDQQVGLLERHDGRVVAVHARHAQGQLVVVGERTPGHERRHDPDVGELGQLAQRLGRPGLEDAAAGVDHRPLGGEDQLGSVLDLAGMPLGRRLVAGQARRDLLVARPVPLHRGARVGRVDDVLGDVDQHRTGTPGRGDVERLTDDAGDVGGVGDQVVVLRDRHRDAGRVALLERIGADRAVGHLPGDADHRHRVEVGVGERRHDVGRRGAGRDHADTGLARHVRIALGHVAGALFVAHQDVADRRVDDRVVHREDRAARQAEDDLDTFHLECLDEGLSPVELHDLLLWSV